MINRPRPFSKRHGYSSPGAEITVRQDAPDELRAAVQALAYKLGLGPSPLREIVCEALLTTPDPGNWSEYPNIRDEVRWLIRDAPWPKVYDIIEAIYSYLLERRVGDVAARFEEETNDFFREQGIGWQLVGGVVETRGPEAFETAVQSATDALALVEADTARAELHEALHDLSRRPEPDLTGACQHAIAALECVAREATGDRTATLGKILERHPGLLPKPLDMVVEKAWGFASNKARHLVEGTPLTYEDAELVVGVAGLVATYLGPQAAEALIGASGTLSSDKAPPGGPWMRPQFLVNDVWSTARPNPPRWVPGATPSGRRSRRPWGAEATALA